MKHSISLLLLSLMIPMISCSGKTMMGAAKSSRSSGKMITKRGSANDINEIDIASAIKIDYVQASGPASYSITYPERYEGKLVLNVKGGKLKVYLNDEISVRDDDDYITLNLKSAGLNEIDLSGACTFSTSTLLMGTQDVEVNISGASSVTIEQLDSSEVEVETSGASNFTCPGMSATKAEFSASGASYINVGTGEFSSIKAGTSGASNIKIGGKADYGEFKCSGASSMDVNNLWVNESSKETSGASNIKGPKK